MREFKVNEYITLKFEDGKTNIYVKGEYFGQCINSMFPNLVNDININDFSDSNDELMDIFDHLYQEKMISGDLGRLISEKNESTNPEIDFNEHCSIMCAWFENDYDTQMLHQNLAL